jgi:hypothetical protein
MKKFILLLFMVCAASYAFSQIKFGPKIGYNASKLSTTADSISSQFKSGFQFGAFVRIGKKFYLQPELYYTTQGGILEKDSSAQSWKQNIKLGSLDVPVLVGFKIINTDLVNLRVMAGPMASFIVNKKITEMNSITGPVTSSDIKNVNWYIQAGAGVDIWFFTLDVRYQIGLNKIINDVSNYQFNTTNNVWVVSLGFKI